MYGKSKLSGIIILFAVVFAFTVSGTAEAKVLWKLQSSYGLSLPCSGDMVPVLAEDLNLASGGELNIKVYDSGKLVPTMEILDAVSDGKIDAGYATAGFWQGKMAAASFFSSIPFGPEVPEYLAWMYYGNGLKLYQEMYDRSGYNVKVLPMAMLVPESSGWFAKPIESAEDLKGLKMRFFGLGAKVMEKLGVSTTLLPPSEVFPALEKGAIDAAEQSIPVIDKKLGFYKVVKYNYFPGWHQQATFMELIINKDSWNKLSDAQKKLVELTCQSITLSSIAYGEASQSAVIKENTEKHDVKTMYWSDEMLALFNEKWIEVVEELAAEDEFASQVWNDLSQFREEYAIWNSLGFLPRYPKK